MELTEDHMLIDQELEGNGIVGTRDGRGASDRDQPYRFGARLRADATYPFNTRHCLRLLVRRGRLQDMHGATREINKAA
jgi:hypothetical protein